MGTEISRRERKKEETRRRIFHAAIDLFRDKGFEATTVDEITERADVARGTFFNYFPRKDSVLAYLSESRLLVVEENAPAMLAADGSAPEKLTHLYLACSGPYEEDRELSRYVLQELMSRAFSPSDDLMPRWQAQVLPLVRQGQERGQLRADTDAVRIESLLTGLYYSTLYQWACLLHVNIPLREELKTRLTLVMEGLQP